MPNNKSIDDAKLSLILCKYIQYFTAEWKKFLIDNSTEDHLQNQQQESEKGDIQLHLLSPSADEDYAQIHPPFTSRGAGYAQLPSPSTNADAGYAPLPVLPPSAGADYAQLPVVSLPNNSEDHPSEEALGDVVQIDPRRVEESVPHQPHPSVPMWPPFNRLLAEDRKISSSSGNSSKWYYLLFLVS